MSERERSYLTVGTCADEKSFLEDEKNERGRSDCYCSMNRQPSFWMQRSAALRRRS
jgi:hypothetical protein